MTDQDVRQTLNQVFRYKAEWLNEKVFDLFTVPRYFSELLTHHPCVLEGGRGMGKTTVLYGLSYQGRHVLDKSNVSDWKSYSFYYRIDTNRVSAFSGSDLPSEKWNRLFGHYANLLLIDLVFDFVRWYTSKTGAAIEFSEQDCVRLTKSLCITAAKSIDGVRESLTDALIDFEAYLNNIADEPSIRISLQGVPIDLLFRTLKKDPEFESKSFCFLIDEYENLSRDQQIVFNTLIKHASGSYVFKIGVREEGWKSKSTLNKDEQLVSPADYKLINISRELPDERFAEFASEVCAARLKAVSEAHGVSLPKLSELLVDLTEEQEANLLKVESVLTDVRLAIDNLPPEIRESLADRSGLELFFIKSWAIAKNQPLESVLKDAGNDWDSWEERFNNYSHAMLYCIRTGKRGIRKYYCGWHCFTHISGGNIRYLLELVDRCLIEHLISGGDLNTPVSPVTQTIAAQEVGRKNLAELEGLSTYGAKLTKLLLGLGRVFGVMAATPVGHAPEVNQFEFGAEPLTEEEESLRRAAIMHLAFVRFSGTKPGSQMDTREYDYSLHPIFAPFFVFSYRQKRKMRITGHDLIALVEKPKETIKRLLDRANRTSTRDLPEQLLLFEKFYDGN